MADQELEQMTAMYEEQKQTSETLQAHLTSLLDELEAKSPIITEQKANYEALIIEYNKLQAKEEAQRQKLTATTKELNELQTELLWATKDRENFAFVVQQQSSQIKVLLREVHKSQYGGVVPTPEPLCFRSIDELAEQNKELLSKLELLGNDTRADDLAKTNDELSQKIQQLEEQIAVREEIGKFPIQGISRAKYQDLESNLQEKTNENSQLYLLYTQAQLENQSLRSKQTQAEKQLLQAQNEIQSIQQSLGETKKSLVIEREKFLKSSTDNLSLQTKLDAKKLKKENLRQENAQLSEKMLLIERELADQTTRHNEQLLKEREERHAEIQSREQDLRRSWTEEIGSLRSEVVLYRSTLNSNVNNSQLEVLKSMYAQLSNQYEILLNSKGTPARDTDTCVVMSEISESLKMAQEECISLKAGYMATNAQLSELQQSNNELLKSFKEQQISLNDSYSMIADLQGKIFIQTEGVQSQLTSAEDLRKQKAEHAAQLAQMTEEHKLALEEAKAAAKISSTTTINKLLSVLNKRNQPNND